ncbi:MAG: c-type cytochrome [Bacteriovoracia bacterium]
MFAWILLLLASPVATAAEGSPLWLDDRAVWAVNPDQGSITAVDRHTLRKAAEISVGRDPRAIAPTNGGGLVISLRGESALATIDKPYSSRPSVRKIELGYGRLPFGLVTRGNRIWVCDEAKAELLKVDLSEGRVTARLALPGAGRALVEDTQGVLYVARFISPDSGGEVYAIDPEKMALLRVFRLAPRREGPDTHERMRGLPNYLLGVAVTKSPDRLWVTGKIDNIFRGKFRDGQPLTSEFTTRGFVAQIDLATGREVAEQRRELPGRDLPVFALAESDRKRVWIASLGTQTLDRLPIAGGAPLSPPIQLPGRAPLAIARDSKHSRLYVLQWLTRDLAIYNLASEPIRLTKTVSLITRETLPAAVLAGKKIFHNAADVRMSAQGRMSCATCHLDGGQDGRVWDFGDRGEGLRNTISLNGPGGTGHGPVHWTGNFNEIQDFEHDMRKAFGGHGFMPAAAFHADADPSVDIKAGKSKALDQLAAYFATLDQAPASPYRLPNGALSPVAERGREVFRKFDCASCHGGPQFTISGPLTRRMVDTIKPTTGQRLGQPFVGIDVPTLKGAWQTPPYFHDGSAATLRDVFLKKNGNGSHGPDKMNDADLNDLVQYLFELDESDAKAELRAGPGRR